jgi:hypothetical protein
MAKGLVLTAPIGALQRSSQPPTSECCDDRLNPPPKRKSQRCEGGSHYDLLCFAEKYRISLDWLICGDMKGLVQTIVARRT